MAHARRRRRTPGGSPDEAQISDEPTSHVIYEQLGAPIALYRNLSDYHSERERDVGGGGGGTTGGDSDGDGAGNSATGGALDDGVVSSDVPRGDEMSGKQQQDILDEIRAILELDDGEVTAEDEAALAAAQTGGDGGAGTPGPNPSEFSNCLAVLPCRCRSCDGGAVDPSGGGRRGNNEDRDGGGSGEEDGSGGSDSDESSSSGSSSGSSSSSSGSRSSSSDSSLSRSGSRRLRSRSTSSAQQRRLGGDGTVRPRSWFLVHPTGEMLDRISVSRVALPSDEAKRGGGASSEDEEDRDKKKPVCEVDVGGRVLQVACVGLGTDGAIVEEEPLEPEEWRGFVVVRTPQHCSVLSCNMMEDRDDERGEDAPAVSGNENAKDSRKRTAETLDKEASGTSSGDSSIAERGVDSADRVPRQRHCCHGAYRLGEVLRIDLGSPAKSSSSASESLPPTVYIPRRITVEPNHVPGPMAHPTFTVLSHSAPPLTSSTRAGRRRKEKGCPPEKNVLHHVTVIDKTGWSAPWACSASSAQRSTTESTSSATDALRHSADRHVISDLRRISLIEHSALHPLVLWSAAQHRVAAALHSNAGNGRKRGVGPYAGGSHGSSLYSVDLRSDAASFLWSPSHESYMVDGTYEVSGLLAGDARRPYSIYAASESAGGTVWEIDARMAGCSPGMAAVCSWSLPGLCEEYGGGGGMLLAQPTTPSARNNPMERYSPVLGLPLKRRAYGLQVYQRPVRMPRFQTRTVEASGACPDAAPRSRNSNGPSGLDGIARSSTFVLPEYAGCGGVGGPAAGAPTPFPCGLAAFRVPIESLLPRPGLAEGLGYGDCYPEGALCALSLTDRGDVYGHALLEGDGEGPAVARAFHGLPAGSAAIPAPVEEDGESRRGGCDASHHGNRGGLRRLGWRLGNTMPAPGSLMLPEASSKGEIVRPFRSIPLEYAVPSYWDSRHGDADEDEEDDAEVRSVPSQRERVQRLPMTVYEPHGVSNDFDPATSMRDAASRGGQVFRVAQRAQQDRGSKSSSRSRDEGRVYHPTIEGAPRCAIPNSEAGNQDRFSEAAATGLRLPGRFTSVFNSAQREMNDSSESPLGDVKEDPNRHEESGGDNTGTAREASGCRSDLTEERMKKMKQLWSNKSDTKTKRVKFSQL